MSQTPIIFGFLFMIAAILLSLIMIFSHGHDRLGRYWSENASQQYYQSRSYVGERRIETSERAVRSMMEALRHDPYDSLYWMRFAVMQKSNVTSANDDAAAHDLPKAPYVQATKILEILEPGYNVSLRNNVIVVPSKSISSVRHE